jgi:hypothetical protein
MSTFNSQDTYTHTHTHTHTHMDMYRYTHSHTYTKNKGSIYKVVSLKFLKGPEVNTYILLLCCYNSLISIYVIIYLKHHTLDIVQ